MKKFSSTLTILLLIIAVSHPVQSQWIHAEGNLPAAWGVLHALDATDSLTAVVAMGVESLNGQYPLYRTVNGGATWTAIPIPTKFGATDVAMTDAQHLWYVNGEGRIYGTTNGGTTWTLQYYDTTRSKYMDYIEMFTATDGIAIGDTDPKLNTPAVVLRTTNGGVSWTPASASALPGEWSGDMWRRMDFVNMNVGYFYASNSGLPYKTTDGGATWTAVPFPKKIAAQVLKFYNESIGLAATVIETPGVPGMYRTTNGGASWEPMKVSDEKGWGNDIEFVPGDPAKVWFTTGGGMFFSADTGRTWTKQVFDSANVKGRDIELVAGGYGWFGCDNHRLYKTSRATAVYNVQTGVGEQTQSVPASIELGQNYPNPFNPSTTIRYALPEAGYASVKIYSVLGREVATLAARHHAAGTYSVTWDASQMSAGVYFYELRSGAYTQTKKLVLVK